MPWVTMVYMAVIFSGNLLGGTPAGTGQASLAQPAARGKAVCFRGSGEKASLPRTDPERSPWFGQTGTFVTLAAPGCPSWPFRASHNSALARAVVIHQSRF